VLFFGFTDFGKSFTSVTISTGQANSLRDIFGIDDVRYVAAPASVPEPASIALAGLALLGLGAARRRKQ
jgi:hypothetical protein